MLVGFRCEGLHSAISPHPPGQYVSTLLLGSDTQAIERGKMS